MAKTKHKLDVERMAQIVWDVHQRMSALEASMFDFAVRQRAMEDLMTRRKLMNPADFNAICQRMIDEIKEMQIDAPDAVGRDPSPDPAAGDAHRRLAVVDGPPPVAGRNDADPVSV